MLEKECKNLEFRSHLNKALVLNPRKSTPRTHPQLHHHVIYRGPWCLLTSSSGGGRLTMEPAGWCDAAADWAKETGKLRSGGRARGISKGWCGDQRAMMPMNATEVTDRTGSFGLQPVSFRLGFTQSFGGGHKRTSRRIRGQLIWAQTTGPITLLPLFPCYKWGYVGLHWPIGRRVQASHVQPLETNDLWTGPGAGILGWPNMYYGTRLCSWAWVADMALVKQ
jgi:hypothetical protein